MEMLAIGSLIVLIWWLSARRPPKKVAMQLMSKWIETAQVAALAGESGTGAALVGKSVSMSDFRFEYGGVSPKLKVSVRGAGAYLGFCGDIMDDGKAIVWFENGSRPLAKKLVGALCKMHPDIINGNKLSARLNDFVRHFATK